MSLVSDVLVGYVLFVFLWLALSPRTLRPLWYRMPSGKRRSRYGFMLVSLAIAMVVPPVIGWQGMSVVGRTMGTVSIVLGVKLLIRMSELSPVAVSTEEAGRQVSNVS